MRNNDVNTRHVFSVRLKSPNVYCLLYSRLHCTQSQHTLTCHTATPTSSVTCYTSRITHHTSHITHQAPAASHPPSPDHLSVVCHAPRCSKRALVVVVGYEHSGVRVDEGLEGRGQRRQRIRADNDGATELTCKRTARPCGRRLQQRVCPPVS